MKTDIFHLQIIDIDDILPHEVFDEDRAKPLMNRLNKDGFLANPIIVSPLDKTKYIQLDGMNRLTSFRLMGLKSILTQIIDYNDQEEVELSSWIHLFTSKEKSLIDCIFSIDDMKLKTARIDQVGHRYIKDDGYDGKLCFIVNKSGDIYRMTASGKLVDKVRLLNDLVTCYRAAIIRDVLPANPNQASIDKLFEDHQESNTMVIFPTFTRHQIVKIVEKKLLFPPGVTRHIIKRRCLNINIPLSIFNKKVSIVKQNAQLETILKNRKFRLYEEPTIYFE